MADIRHRVGIVAGAEQVFQALGNPEGVSGWWTHSEGDSHRGGRLNFFIGGTEPAVETEIVEYTRPERVRRRVIGGVVAEWLGTTISFELKPADSSTVLLFSHTNWRESSELLHHCSTKWATYLIGLKSGLEGGKPAPFPDDVLIAADWH